VLLATLSHRSLAARVTRLVLWPRLDVLALLFLQEPQLHFIAALPVSLVLIRTVRFLEERNLLLKETLLLVM
jgi:hypothetical protein